MAHKINEQIYNIFIGLDAQSQHFNHWFSYNFLTEKNGHIDRNLEHPSKARVHMVCSVDIF